MVTILPNQFEMALLVSVATNSKLFLVPPLFHFVFPEE